jgi:predicted dienelactone hydrolase
MGRRLWLRLLAGWSRASSMRDRHRLHLGHRMEAHTVPGASHVSFLAPCGLLRPVEVCRDPEGFDRKAFHAEMNAQVVQFFNRSLIRL